MKFFFSAACLAAAVSAEHNMCAGAKMINTENMTESSSFADVDTADTRGAAACPTNYFRDQYFRYTATCTGSGLVTVRGNSNFTDIKAAVFADSSCSSTNLSSVASGASQYSLEDMEACVDPVQRTVRGDSTDEIQRFQFLAVNGTEYLIAVGTSSANNATKVGEFDYTINVQCAPPASNLVTAPTVVAAGLVAYSNIGGVVLSGACRNNNNVFFEYNAPCLGDVEIALVPPPSGYDGFHGEDFKIAVYQNAAQLALGEELACQDDPAIITNNITADPVLGPRGGSFTSPAFGAGKVLIVVASFSNAIAPFMLEISEMVCPATMSPSVAPPAPTASASPTTTADENISAAFVSVALSPFLALLSIAVAVLLK